ncbi:MAG: TRAP transporter substrate-binding protein [Alphaproteobacteria bacterium]
MNRRPILAATTFAAALTLASAAGTAQEIEIRFGTVNDPGGVQYESGAEWVKRVNEALGDQVKADIYGSSQLGTDQEMLQKVKLGVQEVAQPSSIMSTVQPEFGVFEMPYIIKDRVHAGCVAKEIIMPELAPKLEEQGYKLLAVWENGFRNITNNVRPINTPEDLQGIKLRTPKGVWRVKMFEAYGANPTPMAFSEVFVALQTGVIDGQENPYANIASAKFQEVQKYLSETNHVYTPSFPTASKKLFDSWPADVQETVLSLANDVQTWTYDYAAKVEGELRDSLQAGGMEFNVADRDAFVAASAPIYEQFAAEVEGGKDLIDRVLALADGC